MSSREAFMPISPILTKGKKINDLGLGVNHFLLNIRENTYFSK